MEPVTRRSFLGVALAAAVVTHHRPGHIGGKPTPTPTTTTTTTPAPAPSPTTSAGSGYGEAPYGDRPYGE